MYIITWAYAENDAGFQTWKNFEWNLISISRGTIKVYFSVMES